MTVDIRDVLNRRSDLSTFVVHLTRDREKSAADNLKSIIASKVLIARAPMGWASDQDGGSANEQSQRVVCFSEAPLEQIHSLVADIAGRTVRLQPYGLALTKLTARAMGANPVWYVDMTPSGRIWEASLALDEMKKRAIATKKFHEQPEASVFPFMEQMGTWPKQGTQKEFWWEREWRHRGDFHFDFEHVAFWLCPEAEHTTFAKLVVDTQTAAGVKKIDQPHCIDPRWGLEGIIANLVGHGDVTPFGPR
jgi:hypothetical protein